MGKTLAETIADKKARQTEASNTENKEKLMANIATEPVRRLNTNIEDSLYKKIKMKSAEDGRSISEITRQLWVEYLSK